MRREGGERGRDDARFDGGDGRGPLTNNKGMEDLEGAVTHGRHFVLPR